MSTTYNAKKRLDTLKNRGLDFEDAYKVIEGDDIILDVDNRFNYGEERLVAIGPLDNMLVVVVWTEEGDDYHVISMREANGPEKNRYRREMDRPG
jgi:uncharacterized DUF497 family protein